MFSLLALNNETILQWMINNMHRHEFYLKVTSLRCSTDTFFKPSLMANCPRLIKKHWIRPSLNSISDLLMVRNKCAIQKKCFLICLLKSKRGWSLSVIRKESFAKSISYRRCFLNWRISKRSEPILRSRSALLTKYCKRRTKIRKRMVISRLHWRVLSSVLATLWESWWILTLRLVFSYRPRIGIL